MFTSPHGPVSDPGSSLLLILISASRVFIWVLRVYHIHKDELSKFKFDLDAPTIYNEITGALLCLVGK